MELFFQIFKALDLIRGFHATLNPKPMRKHHDQVPLLLLINVVGFGSQA
jgi:hypothetical protein